MHCIIVRRGDFQLYDGLYKAFGRQVPVMWDPRRRPGGPAGDERAAPPERRQAPPPSWVALGFVVVDRPPQS